MHTVAPSTPPTAVVVSLSRLDCDGLDPDQARGHAPRSRASSARPRCSARSPNHGMAPPGDHRRGEGERKADHDARHRRSRTGAGAPASNAGLISGGRGPATANANTALSRKLATVSATITSPIGIRIGPRSTWNERPCSTCSLRSNMASQIHIAGRIWTSISRQWDTIRRSASNSSTKAPTARASGAKMRRERLRRSTASSMRASSFSSIARTSDPIRVDSEHGHGQAAAGGSMPAASPGRATGAPPAPRAGPAARGSRARVRPPGGVPR